MGYPYCIHFDTSVVSRNLGDQIIRQSIIDVLDQTVPSLRILISYTHEPPGWKTARLAQRSELNIIGGTNCLTGQRLRYSMWKIGTPSLLLGVRYILLGVGWYRHNNEPDLISSAIYRRALSRQYIHSCRDEYTTKVVRSMGLQAINTGCPTMWGLTADHCKLIPPTKSKTVVFTLTDYNKDKYSDIKMIQCLKNNYEQIFFWPQGLRDQDYLDSLIQTDRNSIAVLRPSLNAFDSFLESHQCDYVGTRLHAGIKALQHSRRSLIISIDNRAEELSRDTGIPILPRKTIGKLNHVLNESFAIEVKLPWSSINDWKNQFKHLQK